jgi:hypothetical protein
LADTAVTANAVHPGGVSTNLGAPPAAVASLLRRFMKTPEQGAFTSLVVATDPELRGVSGAYFVDSTRADDKLSRAARDSTAARELWARSDAMVGGLGD